MGTETADKLPAADWLPFFIKAGVLAKVLNDTGSAKGKAIKIGQFLTPNVNRTVPIQVKGRSGRATLRVRTGTRSKEKLYFFEVAWDVEEPHSKDEPVEGGKNITADIKKAPAIKRNAKTAEKIAPIEMTAPNAPNAMITDKTATAAPKTEPADKTAVGGNDEVWE